MKHHATPRLLVLALLAGCSHDASEAAWIRSFSADWASFNHRLTYLALRPTGDGVRAAFVGGASTTGTIFEDACHDPDTCNELPTYDQGILDVELVRASATDVVLANGTASIDADADGGEGVAHVVLPRRSHASAWGWIAGFTIDGTPPLPDGASSCYDPRYGWLPTHLALEIGSLTVADDGGSVDVPVTATFASGVSREAMRACLDAAAPDAHARIDVDVAVLVGEVDSVVHTLGDQASWPDKGQPQSLEDLGDTTVAFDDPGAIVGWRSLDFGFHEVVDPGRGAYLRTLQVEADPDGDVAFGFATNTSPVTQQSGFDYAFAGTLIELAVDAELTVASFGDDALPADLDAEGHAVLHDLPEQP
jgi:hypothetical protein